MLQRCGPDNCDSFPAAVSGSVCSDRVCVSWRCVPGSWTVFRCAGSMRDLSVKMFPHVRPFSAHVFWTILEPLNPPIPVTTRNNQVFSLISYQTGPITLVTSGDHEIISLLIFISLDSPLILGFPWLKKHNPHIDSLLVLLISSMAGLGAETVNFTQSLFLCQSTEYQLGTGTWHNV